MATKSKHPLPRTWQSSPCARVLYTRLRVVYMQNLNEQLLLVTPARKEYIENTTYRKLENQIPPTPWFLSCHLD